MNTRAVFIDLWLFIRKISLNALAILLTLLLSAALLYGADAWPDVTFLDCCIRSFYMMTLEGVDPPQQWVLELLVFILPALGIIFAAEGLVSATVLFLNRSQRLGEWNAVVASTYKDHIVICGMGQLGGTLSQGLHEAGRKVVAVDLDEDLPHIVTARRRGVPVIVGDMTLPETLAEANIQGARCVVVCSGNDLANIETAITVKEMNPEALVYARVFKKSLADKINAALRYDIRTFSPYATAAESILGQINGG
ncbi:MAG: NAD-binding protein [Armatimonadetes bacterium]|nr:NAD-binding protein [Armatimonadota bacterium]